MNNRSKARSSINHLTMTCDSVRVEPNAWVIPDAHFFRGPFILWHVRLLLFQRLLFDQIHSGWSKMTSTKFLQLHLLSALQIKINYNTLKSFTGDGWFAFYALNAIDFKIIIGSLTNRLQVALQLCPAYSSDQHEIVRRRRGLNWFTIFVSINFIPIWYVAYILIWGKILMNYCRS